VLAQYQAKGRSELGRARIHSGEFKVEDAGDLARIDQDVAEAEVSVDQLTGTYRRSKTRRLASHHSDESTACGSKLVECVQVAHTGTHSCEIPVEGGCRDREVHERPVEQGERATGTFNSSPVVVVEVVTSDPFE
jgi:hypothetical protein